MLGRLATTVTAMFLLHHRFPVMTLTLKLRYPRPTLVEMMIYKPNRRCRRPSVISAIVF
jgi:hypothetical protein